MKTIGIFEAKTRLSEICDEVARTRVSVTVTRRGIALVRIEPVAEQRYSINERREAYMRAQGSLEADDPCDFEPAARSRDLSTFEIKE